MKKLSIVILSLSLILTSCRSKRFIYDEAKILDSKAFNKLDSILKTYQRETTCEIIVYTKEKIPNNKTAYDYSLQLSKNIGTGKKEINNGALILFSLQDKKIELRLGYGFESLISQDTANRIIQSMTEEFNNAKFADGIFKGVEQLIRLTSLSSWEIKPESSGNLSANDILKAKDITVIEKANDYLIIKTKTSQHLKLNFTNFMSALVSDITKGNKTTVYFRVLSSKNDEGYLLGVE